jgi:hypothetical protein
MRAAGENPFSGFWWLKNSEQHRHIGIVGVLRLRATQAPCRGDNPVMRSAQDDGFIGIVKKNTPNK